MPLFSPRSVPVRPRRFTIAALSLSLLVSGCESEEDETRKRIVADYAREIDGRPTTPFVARQVLSLRVDGTWKRTSHIETRGEVTDSPADSGTFRIQGVTLVLRSLVEAGQPIRYTISGDTLYNANATQVKALTGYDIGEEALVRVR